mmetsp:Transcript_38835/g.94301  ORF Transcript_38835/g.94301 Transcript_38835/m.94301 type:complete len:82 (+) Transcript_38835:225-470(+)
MDEGASSLRGFHHTQHSSGMMTATLRRERHLKIGHCSAQRAAPCPIRKIRSPERGNFDPTEGGACGAVDEPTSESASEELL